MIIFGLVISVARWIYNAELTVTIFSFLIAFLISLVLYACKIFGGADAKAMTCISLIIPRNVSASLTPYFTLTVFLNTFIILGILYLTILTYNLIQHLKGETLFYGLESESKCKKLVVLLTCIRLDPDSLQNKSHFYPIQHVKKKNGEKEIQLTSHRNILTKESKNLKILEGKKEVKTSNKVWAYFTKPLIPIITLSVVMSFFLGDLPLLLLQIL